VGERPICALIKGGAGVPTRRIARWASSCPRSTADAAAAELMGEGGESNPLAVFFSEDPQLRFGNGSPSRTRTYDLAINSRVPAKDRRGQTTTDQNRN